MFHIIWRLNQKRIINKISKRCCPFLTTSYGRKPFYSKGQIETALTATKCSKRHIMYAHVLFGSEEIFSNSDKKVYDEMREIIAETCLHGNLDFNAEHIIAYTKRLGSWHGDSRTNSNELLDGD